MEQNRKRPGPKPTPFDAPRTCPQCKQHQPADSFPLDQSRPNGRYPYCKPCKARIAREATARRKASGRMEHENLLRSLRRYGVTLEWHEQQVALTGGVCAVCGGSPTGNHKRLVVDHRHSTGIARGLLCGACNTAIGALGDSPANLRAAADYLERQDNGSRNHQHRQPLQRNLS